MQAFFVKIFRLDCCGNYNKRRARRRGEFRMTGVSAIICVESAPIREFFVYKNELFRFSFYNLLGHIVWHLFI
ncbi:MAG: hypothetical protein A3D44_01500 [Candidatus Staskawiczbacteria bacterium RIFCSPHIGHO2_02_FULL_42_22]|uniref:Uncharacterized protein n=1 Tax=Candidatus Staskawiczbacteria bacterium RIFCSPHIGHO2_02_FULL_42_22 TaxID=1802207 RepID=A0A1G2HZH8_9BACT|nr:MAG: hypothetical protein A3D44_01500 [Candidatus Staskawiczbacteria bacterium RIFCSPHIGHO2_02_FULL_42_22]